MTKKEIQKTERLCWITSVVISVSAVALIGLSSRGMLPDALAPRLPKGFLTIIPELNAALVLVGLTASIQGYRSIKKQEVSQHMNYMVLASTAFFTFLALYLLRLANLGLTEYPGTEAGYQFVYLPLLTIHMILATVSIPLVLFCLFTAASLGRENIPDTTHPRVGKIAVPLWTVSFALGFVVYLLLHHIQI